MHVKEIHSVQHPIVKHLVNLRNSRSYRSQEKNVLVIGKKMVFELASRLPIRTLIVKQGIAIPREIEADSVLHVSAQVLKKITGVENPEPYAAEIPLPPPADLSKKKFLLALDGVADPGNLGTLLRTALALGWEGVFITGESTDPFNDKALRAAKGATFQLPFFCGTHQELEKLLQKGNFSLYIADAKGSDVRTQKAAKSPLILLLGSESHGVKFSSKTEAERVAIPLPGQVESLNVAIAGALLMFQMGPSS